MPLGPHCLLLMNRVFSCRRPRVYWRYLVVLNDNVADLDLCWRGTTILLDNVADPFLSLVTTILRNAAPSRALFSRAFSSTDRPRTRASVRRRSILPLRLPRTKTFGSISPAIHLEALAHETTRFFRSISYSAFMPLSGATTGNAHFYHVISPALAILLSCGRYAS